MNGYENRMILMNGFELVHCVNGCARQGKNEYFNLNEVDWIGMKTIEYIQWNYLIHHSSSVYDRMNKANW